MYGLLHEGVQFVVSRVEVPIEITEIVTRDVIAVIGELDRLASRFAAPLALERTFRAPLREQLELFEAA